MSIRKAAMAALVAGSMVVVPTIAQAASANKTGASSLSVRSAQQVRSGATVAKKNNLQGGSLLLALAAAAAVVGGIVIASGGGNNATSP